VREQLAVHDELVHVTVEVMPLTGAQRTRRPRSIRTRDSADGANRHAHRLKKAPASVKSGSYCRGPGIKPWLESLS
jgi:hypothetical protein